MENEYSIFALFERLKEDDSLPDDPETRARYAEEMLMLLSY